VLERRAGEKGAHGGADPSVEGTCLHRERHIRLGNASTQTPQTEPFARYGDGKPPPTRLYRRAQEGAPSYTGYGSVAWHNVPKHRAKCKPGRWPGMAWGATRNRWSSWYFSVCPVLETTVGKHLAPIGKRPPTGERLPVALGRPHRCRVESATPTARRPVSKPAPRAEQERGGNPLRRTVTETEVRLL